VVSVSVRLPGPVHRAVKVRAASEGRPVEALARDWFGWYADGLDVVSIEQQPPFPTVFETDQHVLPVPNEPRPVSVPPTGDVAAPKTGRRRTTMCEHRVPAGSFCKMCDQGTAA
jgi:hypothetical protein